MTGLRSIVHGLRRLARRHPRVGGLLRRLGSPLKPYLTPLLSDLADDARSYRAWLAQQERLAAQEERLIRQALARYDRLSRFLVILPLDEESDAAATLHSLNALRAQLYTEWRVLVLAGQGAVAGLCAKVGEIAAEERRIKLHRKGERRADGERDPVSFVAEMAEEGEGPLFVVPLGAGDCLARSALAEVALTAALHPSARLIYSDEDRIDRDGRRHTPYFKPDFDPELMLAQNLIGGLAAYRADLIAELGDLPPAADVLAPGAAHGLLLRAADLAHPGIEHIPSILYHRRDRALNGRELEARAAAARASVAAYLAAKGITAEVGPAPGFPALHRIAYALPERLPRISVIIPTRDRADLLRSCLEGLLGRTDYPDLEIWIIDNESREPETLALFAAVAEDPRVHRLSIPGPFNYSRLNNLAAAAARGEFLLLLNNDVKVIEPNWLKEMMALALRPGVGAVGAKLLYPDETIQHAGVVLGMGWPEGVAGHLFCHAPRHHRDPYGLTHVARSASAVTAACLLVRRDVFLEVGGFDEVNLAVAFTDVDFCLRLAECGYRHVWTPHAELYHFESASRGKDLSMEKAERLYREIAFMRRRWGEVLDTDPYWNPNLGLQDGMRRLSETPRHMPVWLEVLGRPPGAAPREARELSEA